MYFLQLVFHHLIAKEVARAAIAGGFTMGLLITLPSLVIGTSRPLLPGTAKPT
jgi:hypothetical protein